MYRSCSEMSVRCAAVNRRLGGEEVSLTARLIAGVRAPRGAELLLLADPAQPRAHAAHAAPDPSSLVDAVQLLTGEEAARLMGSDKAHECPNCGKRYSQRGNLQRHLKLECGKKPQFQCPVCWKTFTRKDNMKMHTKMLHSL